MLETNTDNMIVLLLPSGKELHLTETIKSDGVSILEIISHMTDHDRIANISDDNLINAVSLKLDFHVDL